MSFIVSPYIVYYIDHMDEAWNYSFINVNETLVLDINMTLENYRSFKPVKMKFYMTNMTYKTIFQYETLEFSNTVPQ